MFEQIGENQCLLNKNTGKASPSSRKKKKKGEKKEIRQIKDQGGYHTNEVCQPFHGLPAFLSGV